MPGKVLNTPLTNVALLSFLLTLNTFFIGLNRT